MVQGDYHRLSAGWPMILATMSRFHLSSLRLFSLPSSFLRLAILIDRPNVASLLLALGVGDLSVEGKLGRSNTSGTGGGRVSGEWFSSDI